jgi:hypothetical protein
MIRAQLQLSIHTLTQQNLIFVPHCLLLDLKHNVTWIDAAESKVNTVFMP